MNVPARIGIIVDEVAPVKDGPRLLRESAHFLAQLAVKNPRMVQTSGWQMATEGLARTLRELDEMRNVIVVEFASSEEAQAARNFLRDPNQLTLKFG